MTTVTYFAHHGINYVPLGFGNAHLTDNSEVVGGSAYGSGTVTNGDGSRQPSAKELELAKFQGEAFGKLLNTFAKGKARDSKPEVQQKQEEVTAKPKESQTPKPREQLQTEKPEKSHKKCFCM